MERGRQVMRPGSEGVRAVLVHHPYVGQEYGDSSRLPVRLNRAIVHTVAQDIAAAVEVLPARPQFGILVQQRNSRNLRNNTLVCKVQTETRESETYRGRLVLQVSMILPQRIVLV